MKQEASGDHYMTFMVDRILDGYAASAASLAKSEAPRLAKAESRLTSFRKEKAAHASLWAHVYDFYGNKERTSCRAGLYEQFAEYVRGVHPTRADGLAKAFVTDSAAALFAASLACKDPFTEANSFPDVGHFKKQVTVPLTELDAWAGRPQVNQEAFGVRLARSSQRTVSSVSPKGESSIVEFKTERTLEDVVHCRTTDHVESINLSTGRLRYTEECTVVGKEWRSDSEPPLKVRADVAAKLSPGVVVALGSPTVDRPLQGERRVIYAAYRSKSDAKDQVNFLVLFNVPLQE
jgi:hypothetical protein